MKHRIVVLGAGYAGTFAAGRLSRQLHADDTQITVVNADPDFVERIRLHQLAAGQPLRRRRLADIFAGTGISLQVARVSAIDADRHTVRLAGEHGEQEIGYDTLVFALGSAADRRSVPGVAEHAHDVAGKQAALRLRDRLVALSPGGSVLVAGGGLTGIEAATEIAEARPDLHVTMALRGELGDWLNERSQRHLREVFDHLGIAVREHTEVARVDATGAVTVDAQWIPAEVTVWAAGFVASPIAAASSLTVSESGQIVVDDTMRSVSHPQVYAVGDASYAQGPGDKPLRMSCASGIPTAWQAADAIAARLTGRRVPHLAIRYYGQCISLGRRNGLLQFVTADDRATGSQLTGRRAARVKELICSGAAWGATRAMVLPARRRRSAPVPARI